LICGNALKQAIFKSEKELDLLKKQNRKLLSEISKERIEVYKKLDKIRGLYKKYNIQSENDLAKKNELEQINIELKQKLTDQTYEMSNFIDSVKQMFTWIYTENQNSIIQKAKFKYEIFLKNQNFDFVSPEQIESISNFFFEELDQSRKIISYKGSFYDSKGIKKNGVILRVGKKAVYFKEKENFGFLQMAIENNYLYKIPDLINWTNKNYLRSFYGNLKNSGVRILPIDISAGKGFLKLKSKKSFMEHIKNGGILVYPLILIAFLSVIIFVERLIVLR
jgi:biopolymer transport protein ExbB